MKGKKFDVLDKGYIILQDYMGDDLTVVNSARVSYNKKKEVLDDKDKGLISFLGNAKPPHSEPFYHPVVQFEIYAPLMVARQWWKYIVGSDHRDPLTAWSESSRRYVTEEPEFYVPNENEWRSMPENKKQGSGENLPGWIGGAWTEDLIKYIEQGTYLYEEAMKQGIATEQARLFLPAYGMYVRWYWTCSLQSVAHFLNQRLAHDAQKEIRDYANTIEGIVNEIFPNSLKHLLKDVERVKQS